MKNIIVIILLSLVFTNDNTYVILASLDGFRYNYADSLFETQRTVICLKQTVIYNSLF